MPPETIRHLLLDQVIPRIVSHRGGVVLHAGAVKYGSDCIVVVGESGWGKSTLATSLHLQGKQILTDDCLMLKRKNGRVVAVPSYCGARLLEDSLDHFKKSEKKVGNVSHYSSKKRLDLNCDHTENECGVPVVAFFVLGSPGSEKQHLSLNIELLTNSNATTNLLKHSFQMEQIDMRELSSKLQMFSVFTTTGVPFYTLSYSRDYEFLPSVEKAVSEVVKKTQGIQNLEIPGGFSSIECN